MEYILRKCPWPIRRIQFQMLCVLWAKTNIITNIAKRNERHHIVAVYIVCICQIYYATQRVLYFYYKLMGNTIVMMWLDIDTQFIMLCCVVVVVVWWWKILCMELNYMPLIYFFSIYKSYEIFILFIVRPMSKTTTLLLLFAETCISLLHFFYKIYTIKCNKSLKKVVLFLYFFIIYCLLLLLFYLCVYRMYIYGKRERFSNNNIEILLFMTTIGRRTYRYGNIPD